MRLYPVDKGTVSSIHLLFCAEHQTLRMLEKTNSSRRVEYHFSPEEGATLDLSEDLAQKFKTAFMSPGVAETYDSAVAFQVAESFLQVIGFSENLGLSDNLGSESLGPGI